MYFHISLYLFLIFNYYQAATKTANIDSSKMECASHPINIRKQSINHFYTFNLQVLAYNQTTHLRIYSNPKIGSKACEHSQLNFMFIALKIN